MNIDFIDDVFTGQIKETELVYPTTKPHEVIYVSYGTELVERTRTRIVLLADMLD